MWVTQIEGSVIEEAGVIKMDFLGLKTLNIIKTSLQLIKMNHGIEIDIDKIPLDDEKTFKLYQKGETIGTFQFESPGMQKYLRDLKPDKFEDLIAMNALYRPGPLEYIPNFINRKHGREEISYDLPAMQEYLLRCILGADRLIKQNSLVTDGIHQQTAHGLIDAIDAADRYGSYDAIFFNSDYPRQITHTL